MKSSIKTNIYTILVVDDEEYVHRSLQRSFAKYNYNLIAALSGAEALKYLAEHTVDLVVLDLKMPGIDGMDALKEIKTLYPDLKVIIQTGHGGVGEAVEALKNGASDFYEKGRSPEILRTRINQLYEIWMLSAQNKELVEKSSPQFSFSQMVGESDKIKKLKDMIVRVAPTDTTVLIQGESGTGKELVARAIHHHSGRAKGPFVPVDCAAISSTVIESELFGHAKGAFTGAETATLGLIRSADHGTLFLDEVGELSTAIQAKFLRTIQERVIRPVGSTKMYSVDIRIVAATNRNLLDEVSDGAFRQDLYYRLTTITLTSPPLKDRGQDIELLSEHILGTGGDSVSVSKEAVELIRGYKWPGNVRELENVLRGATIFAENGLITPQDLPSTLTENSNFIREEEEALPEGTLASYELRAIKEALGRANNNRRKAAEILDIAEATLYRKIKHYKL